MHPLSAPGSLVLGYLAFVVGEHQIHSASVDIKLPSQILLPHHRALQVPARETLSPRRIPPHNMLRLSLLP